jgi:hypothetical protein
MSSFQSVLPRDEIRLGRPFAYYYIDTKLDCQKLIVNGFCVRVGSTVVTLY